MQGNQPGHFGVQRRSQGHYDNNSGSMNLEWEPHGAHWADLLPHRRGEATLVIKGPTQTVVQGENVRLECQLTGPLQNPRRQVCFEFYRWGRWTTVWDETSWFAHPLRRSIFCQSASPSSIPPVIMEGPVTYRTAGSYRCVVDTDYDKHIHESSEILNITVNSLDHIDVHQSGFLRQPGFLRPSDFWWMSNYDQDSMTSVEGLKVVAGHSVELECSSKASAEPQYQWSKEGSDWILPSSKLKLQDIQEQDAGNYTCVAKHPIVDSLIRNYTISITVLPVTRNRVQTAFGSQVRLVNGPNSCSGRVEILHSGSWGTVCDDSWDLNDATVVCRQAGCGRALSAQTSARYGQGSGSIWLDEVRCSGRESTLFQCSHQGIGNHDCSHGEDAGVECEVTRNSVQRTAIASQELSWWQSLAWYHFVIMVTVPLLLVTAVVYLYRRRAKLADISKGPMLIDDHSEKKSIYKSSAESLPSVCGDNQPLVRV